jgi:hypothetical protein
MDGPIQKFRRATESDENTCPQMAADVVEKAKKLKFNVFTTEVTKDREKQFTNI